jgi:hypothetical protein
MHPARPRLGQLLVEARIISAEQLETVLGQQKTDPRRLGTLLVEGGYLNETQLTQVLSQQLNAPWVSLYHIDFSRRLLNLVPREIVELYCLVPIYVRNVRGQGDTLYVAMEDPSNDEALRACETSSGLPAKAMIAPPSDIRNAIRVYYNTRARGPSIRPAAPAPEPAAPLAPPAPPAVIAPEKPDASVFPSPVAKKDEPIAPEKPDASVFPSPLSRESDPAWAPQAVDLVRADAPQVSTSVRPRPLSTPPAASPSVRPAAPTSARPPAPEPPAAPEAREPAAPAVREPQAASEPSTPLPELDEADEVSDHIELTPFFRGPSAAPPAAGSPVPARGIPVPAAAPSSPAAVPAPPAAVPAPPASASSRPPAAPDQAQGPAWFPPGLSLTPSDPLAPDAPFGPDAAAPAAPAARPAARRAARMINLTLLDGTTLALPAKPPRRPRAPRLADPDPESAEVEGAVAGVDEGPSSESTQLTARDLVAALRAVSHGADASEILGDNARWEALFATLLSLLLKKHLIADWEFVEEFKRI